MHAVTDIVLTVGKKFLSRIHLDCFLLFGLPLKNSSIIYGILSGFGSADKP